MTLKDFFVGRAIVFASVLLIALTAFLGRTYLWPETPKEPLPEESRSIAQPVAFAWRFAESDSLNPDGVYATDVLLDVTYADGTTEAMHIDTSHGSCNELPDADEDHAEGTAIIQCYGAGLGYRYKVTGDGSAYVVQRKEFEEASPDYAPAAQEYETLARIPS